jgi:hypothetical protein
MAISLTTLNGTDSVAASRITLNDNFNTVLDAMNDLLSIVDIATGKINNYGYGSNNDMETEDLIVRGSTGGGISIITGNVTVNTGNVIIGSNGYFEIGSGSGARIERINKNSSTTVATYLTWNFSGIGATGGTGPMAYLTLPRKSTAEIFDIEEPQLGALVYDISTNQARLCIGSSAGGTGTWTTL